MWAEQGASTIPSKPFGVLVVWHVSRVQELLLALFICVCVIWRRSKHGFKDLVRHAERNQGGRRG